jgi:NAD-dependent dihydropyrimidine dehydrogenase PreA subunit
MAKKWYPIIDYPVCAECGACINKCPHGVYDIAKVPSPVVLRPDNCVDHCHGCGNLCPQGAITYVGDDTGWTPPNGARAPEAACCSCGNEETREKKVRVEYLYLDLKTCDRCIGTDTVLDEVMAVLAPALQLAGYLVEYSKIEMKTAELAERHRFISSPTIRINGLDICGPVKESACGCCGEISGTDVDCRVFEYNGEVYEIPPKEMLAEAILETVFGASEPGCSCGYALPENLRNFFKGKNNSGCFCGEGNIC